MPNTSGVQYAVSMYSGFVSWIESRAAARGWSLTDLSRESGVSLSTIGRWRSGKIRPTIQQVRKIAAALDEPMRLVYVRVGWLTRAEAGLELIAPDPGLLTNEQLITELLARMRPDSSSNGSSPYVMDLSVPKDESADD